MKNKMLAGLVLSAVVTSSLFANYAMGMQDKRGMQNQDCPMGMMSDKRGMQNQNCPMGGMMQGKGNFHKSGHGMKDSVFGAIRQLNLSDEQQAKIKDIMLENRKNMKSGNEAFSKNSFDKNKYIEIMSQKRENMIKSKAQTIEKVYALLDDKQKEQLKVLMDLRKERMESFPRMMGNNR